MSYKTKKCAGLYSKQDPKCSNCPYADQCHLDQETDLRDLNYADDLFMPGVMYPRKEDCHAER